MVATKLFTRAAALLAAVHQVSAIGSAVVHNQCPFDVYLWSISNVDSVMQTLPAKGGEYTETYRTNPNGGGISIKMGSDKNCQNITQYEYTLDNDSLWYDLSNINGYPFVKYGVTVVPGDANCRGVSCPAGTPLCAAAYNIPSDNFATAECGSAHDTVVVLCSGANDTTTDPSISSIASKAASTASPVSSFSTTSKLPATTTYSSHANPTATYVSHSVHTPPHHSVVQQVATTAKAVVSDAPVNNNPYVVVQTTFVTHIVTVEARSAEPTAAVEAKRDVHHEHAAVHQEHVARRHQHPRAFPKA